jgi:hypothetical protein
MMAGKAGSPGREVVVMAETTSLMSLTLTPEERNLLLRLVRAALGDTRVELHRTHFSPEFRAQVQQEEALLRSVLTKLSGQAGS